MSNTTELSSTIGLANLGNTCFLNVVLQALRLSPPLGDIFLNNTIHVRPGSQKQQLLEAFQILMKDFWKIAIPKNAKPTLFPRGFYGTFLKIIHDTGDSWHRFGQQSDAAETIQYILNSLHDAMYKKVTMVVTGSASNPEEKSYVKAIESWESFFGKEYSPIIEHYNGQTQTEVICNNCKAVSTRYEPWLMLKVPLPGGDQPNRTKPDATLTECLDLAFADETLDDYQCDACKLKGKATIRNRISKLPDVVILTLKRFTNNMQKVSGKINWDLDGFDFRPWMAFRGDPFHKTYTLPIYETTSLIEQQGSFRGGHYQMYAKQDGVWNEYDDNNIREVPGETASNADIYVALLTRKSVVNAMNARFCAKISALRESVAAAAAAAAAEPAEPAEPAEA